MSYSWNYSDPYQYMSRVSKNQMPPVIVSVAITGGGGTRKQNPHLPVSPDEQSQQTYEAYKSGASAVHIHARDNSGDTCVYGPERYREINRKIRALCPDIIVGNSTGVTPPAGLKEALGILDAAPEICSLNMGAFALRPGGTPKKGDRDKAEEWIFPFNHKFIEAIAEKAIQNNIKPELEIYHAGMYEAMQSLTQLELLKKPYWVQLVFATHSSAICSPQAVLNMVGALPEDSMFSIIGAGVFEFPLNAMGIILGGHVRVGLEDNYYVRRGQLAETNAQLVEKAVRLINELGREVATPAQAREMLGISQTPRMWD